MGLCSFIMYLLYMFSIISGILIFILKFRFPEDGPISNTHIYQNLGQRNILLIFVKYSLFCTFVQIAVHKYTIQIFHYTGHTLYNAKDMTLPTPGSPSFPLRVQHASIHWNMNPHLEEADLTSAHTCSLRSAANIIKYASVQ